MEFSLQASIILLLSDIDKNKTILYYVKREEAGKRIYIQIIVCMIFVIILKG